MRIRRTGAAVALSTTLALGCGNVVVTPPQTSESTSASGGSGETSSGDAAGVGGAGGAPGSVVTGGAPGTVVTSVGAGGAPACASDVGVDISGDGPVKHIDASCQPDAHLIMGSPGGSKSPPPPMSALLTVSACTVGPDPVLALVVPSFSGPGPALNATFFYYRDGVEYSASAGNFVGVTRFDPPGGKVEGTFKGVVNRVGPGAGPATLGISGEFRVCRSPDEELL